MKRIFFFFFLILGLVISSFKVLSANSPEKLYENLQKKLASGWNTWDTRSVLTHVFLPYGFAVDLNRNLELVTEVKGRLYCSPGLILLMEPILK